MSFRTFTVGSGLRGLDGDAVAEVDGEGVDGCFPAVAAGAAFSSFADAAVAVDVPSGDVADPEVEQLDRGVVVGEVAAVLDDLAQLPTPDHPGSRCPGRRARRMHSLRRLCDRY